LPERVDTLNRRIALYRRHLAEAVDADPAQTDLRERKCAEAEPSNIMPAPTTRLHP